MNCGVQIGVFDVNIISNALKRFLIFPGYDTSVIIFLTVAVG